MDMDDFLKKAMESEMSEDDESDFQNPFDKFESIPQSEALKGMIKMLGLGKMLELGKEAIDYRDKLLNKLIDDLSKLDRSDKAAFHAKASARILSDARKLNILNIIVSASSLSGLHMNGDPKDVIKSVILANML